MKITAFMAYFGFPIAWFRGHLCVFLCATVFFLPYAFVFANDSPDGTFSADGKRLLIYTNGRLEQFNAVTGESLGVLSAEQQWFYGYTPNDKRIIASLPNGHTSLWDATAYPPTKIRDLDLDLITKLGVLRYSSDGNLLLISEDTQVSVWDMLEGKLLWTSILPPGTAVLGGDFCEDALHVVLALSDKSTPWLTSLQRLDLANGQKSGTPQTFPGRLAQAGVSRAGKRIATWSLNEKDQAKAWVRIFGLPAGGTSGSGIPINRPEDERDLPVYFLNDLEKVVVIENGDELQLWDAEGTLLTTLPTTGKAVVSSHDRMAFRNEKDGVVKVYDAETFKPVGVLPLKARFSFASFTPDSKYLAVILEPRADGHSPSTPAAASAIVQFWDLLTFRQSGRPIVAERGVQDLFFNLDGTRMLTRGAQAKEGRNPHLWNVQERCEIPLRSSAAKPPRTDASAGLNGNYGAVLLR